MKYGKLILEKNEFKLIKQYLKLNHTYQDYAHKNTLDTLEKLMSEAMIVDEEHVPSDVARLYSSITVTCNSQWQEMFILVAPSEENIRRNKTSVMSTLGASIIGLSQGDVIKYGLPGSSMSLKIEKVEPRKNRNNRSLSKEVLDSTMSEVDKK
ncbi:GreA/GreB family elongation factor [Maribacter chungangensis]|uniref:GreA/GreB family elongation factor n=1 Tax=Maribacter chungangensis TaxID=1069117 RepID=A0ABW3B8J0_9FLAO